MSMEMPASKKSFGCWKIGLIGCGVLSFLLLAYIGVIIYMGYKYIAKNPAMKQQFMNVGQCSKNMAATQGALERYKVRHNKYPSDLSQLVPTFLANRVDLHCPSDKTGLASISYKYIQPAPNASDTTVILTCDKHGFAGKNIVLRMQKNGKMAKSSANSSTYGGANPVPVPPAPAPSVGGK